jgi:hypothetical protein
VSENKVDYDVTDKFLANDPNNLAKWMLEWFEKQCDADRIKYHIEKAVKYLGKTVTVGTIRCSYYKDKANFGPWEDAVLREAAFLKDEGNEEEAERVAEAIKQHTTTETLVKTDWKAVCEQLELERDNLKPTPARATLKVLE